MSSGGFFAVAAMPVVGFVLGRGTDARWVIITGLLVMTAGNYWMSQLNLDISPAQVVWPRVVLVLGLSICFAPANVAAYLYTATAATRSGRRLVEPAAQRGRQRGDVIGADNAGAP
jgi:MFS transporter, DHA2 family, multidrug resistance protein